MSQMTTLPPLTDENLAAWLAAERSILVLTRGTCGHCQAYQAEIAALQARGHLAGWPVGLLVLDQPGAHGFKRANPWLAGLTVLPYTLIYSRGQRIDNFAASKGAYLLERLAELPPASDPHAVELALVGW